MKEKLRGASIWLLTRLSERSTWVGFFLLAGAIAGHQFDDHTINTITDFGMLVAGALLAYEEKK